MFEHGRFNVAAIELEVIDVPVSKRLSIQLHVVQTARESSTRLGANVLVYAELETLRVYLSCIPVTNTVHIEYANTVIV